MSQIQTAVSGSLSPQFHIGKENKRLEENEKNINRDFWFAID